MDTDPVTSPRRRQELTILTTYSESVFLLASWMFIDMKPVELLPAPVGRGYVLQCEWPYFQLPFEEVLTPVAELLQSCGASRVGKFWSGPSPVFDVNFDSQASIKQMINSLESGQIRKGMESIILALTQKACSQTIPDGIPEWKLDISLELLQVLPDSDTKDAIIHRVTSTNSSMCVHLWNERKVFDVAALLRLYKSKPLGGIMGESFAASGDIQLLNLLRELKEVVGWMQLGLHLGIPKHTLETIRCQYAMHGVEMCKTEMLSTWLDGHTEEPTWAEVVSAVSRTGNKRVAKKIADKYGLALAVLTEANSATEVTSIAMATNELMEPLRRETEGTHRAVEENEVEIQCYTRKKRKLEGDLAETQYNCDIVQRYTEMLTKDKESLEQKLEEREKEIRSLQSKQLEYERTIRDLEVKLATAGAKTKWKLKEKLKLIKQEKEELVGRIAAKQKEVSNLTKKTSKLTLKLEHTKMELSSARSELELKTSQLDEFQQKLQLVQDQRDELKKQLEMQEKAMEEVIMEHVQSDEVASKVGELPLKTTQLDEFQQKLQLVQELKKQLEMQEKAMDEAVMQSADNDKVTSKPFNEPFSFLEIRLTRQLSGFGFRIIGGKEEGSQATVGEIVAGGAADLDGRLRVGDEIRHINNRSVMDASHLDVISFMGEAAAQGEVVLGIGRKMPMAELVPPPQGSQSLPSENSQPPIPQGVREIVIQRPNMQTSFGFVLQFNTLRAGCIISRLIPDSPAEMCGQLYIYDELLAVNGISVSLMDQGDLTTLIKSSGTIILLTVEQSEAIEALERNNMKVAGQSMHAGAYSMGKTHRDDNQRQYQDHPDVSYFLNDSPSDNKEIHHIIIQRDVNGFGFSIRGGVEYAAPLKVLRIAGGGAADNDGRLKTGDELLEINGISTEGMLHHKAITIIKHGGNLVELVVRRLRTR